MPARSMTNQQLALARETTAGTPATTGFKRVQSLRATVGYAIEGDDFKASGAKVNTARIPNSEMGTVGIDTILDYNGALWTATGGYGAPASVAGTAAAVGTNTHTFLLNAYSADPKVTFTGFWGDSVQALQLAHFVFNTFGISIARGALSLTSSAMSYMPKTGIAFPSAGAISDVGTRPMAGRQFNIYMDNSWATLGTTQLLAAYEGGLTFGEKYTPDWTINRALTSFSEVLEAESTEYKGNLRVGFDGVALSLLNTFNAGDLKFIRIESIGPVIAGTIPSSLVVDFCVRITGIGEYSAAPNSPAVSVPFDFTLAVDDTTTNVSKLVLVNAITGL